MRTIRFELILKTFLSFFERSFHFSFQKERKKYRRRGRRYCSSGWGSTAVLKLYGEAPRSDWWSWLGNFEWFLKSLKCWRVDWEDWNQRMEDHLLSVEWTRLDWFEARKWTCLWLRKEKTSPRGVWKADYTINGDDLDLNRKSGWVWGNPGERSPFERKIKARRHKTREEEGWLVYVWNNWSSTWKHMPQEFMYSSLWKRNRCTWEEIGDW